MSKQMECEKLRVEEVIFALRGTVLPVDTSLRENPRCVLPEFREDATPEQLAERKAEIERSVNDAVHQLKADLVAVNEAFRPDHITIQSHVRAAALSFQYCLGSISRATWPDDVKHERLKEAAEKILAWDGAYDSRVAESNLLKTGEWPKGPCVVKVPNLFLRDGTPCVEDMDEVEITPLVYRALGLPVPEPTLQKAKRLTKTGMKKSVVPVAASGATLAAVFFDDLAEVGRSIAGFIF